MSASPTIPSSPPPIPAACRRVQTPPRLVPTHKPPPLPRIQARELDVTRLARPIDLVPRHHDALWGHVLLDLELRWSLFESLTALQDLTHEVHTPAGHINAFAGVVRDAHPGTRQVLARFALAWHAYFIQPYWPLTLPSLTYLRWRADV